MDRHLPAVDVSVAREKIVQAMDNLYCTRLWLDKRSPEWATVLKIECELFKTLKSLKTPK